MSIIQNSVVDPRDGGAGSQIKAWLSAGQGHRHKGPNVAYTPASISSISADTSGGGVTWGIYGTGTMAVYEPVAGGSSALRIVQGATGMTAGAAIPAGVVGVYVVMSNLAGGGGYTYLLRNLGLIMQISTNDRATFRAFTSGGNWTTPESAETDVSGAGPHLIFGYFDQAANLARCRVDNGVEQTVATTGTFDATGPSALIGTNGSSLPSHDLRLHDMIMVSDRGNGLDAQIRAYLAAKHGGSWS